MKKEKLSLRPKGVIAALPTPFSTDGALDEGGLRQLVAWLVNQGVDALMPLGGTGEFPHLLPGERRRVIAIVLEETRGRIPVIAGTAACSTRETLLLTQEAAQAGADAAIMVPPFYFKLPEDAILRHFRTIAREGAIPVVIYDNPLYTGNPLSPRLIAELLNLPGVIGLKESNSDLGHLAEVIRLTRGLSTSICTGIDSQFLAALLTGANGIYSTAASIIPKQMGQVYKLSRSGKIGQARRLQDRLQHLHHFLEYDPGYVAPCKEALRMLGLPAGYVRSPLPELSAKERGELRQALSGLGLLKDGKSKR